MINGTIFYLQFAKILNFFRQLIFARKSQGRSEMEKNEKAWKVEWVGSNFFHFVSWVVS